MVRKIIQLTESQSQGLQRRAAEEQVSFSEMIRRSVDMLLKDKPRTDAVRERAKAAVGYASSGETDISVRHDDYLAEAYSQ